MGIRCLMNGLALAIATSIAAMPTIAQPSGSALKVEMRTTKISEQDADRALNVFKEICAPLFRDHLSDIVRIKAIAEDGWSPRATDWGWGVEIWIEVELTQQAKTFSPSIRAWGHTLYFFLGGGRRPGFQAQKPVSLAACGRSGYDVPSEEFVNAPALSFLPHPQSATAEERAIHEEHWRNAFEGSHSGQFNIAHCYRTGCNGIKEINPVLACAWRIVIARGPHGRWPDIVHLSRDCQALAKSEVGAAEREANGLFTKIYRRQLPPNSATSYCAGELQAVKSQCIELVPRALAISAR